MSELPDPEAGCRDGFRFECVFECGESFWGVDFASIARRAARHYNREHTSDIKHSHEVVDTVERGGHHVRDNVYQVERVSIYVTPFDMAERVGAVDGWLVPVDSENVCSECYCHIPDDDDRIEDNPDDIFDESWICAECVAAAEVEKREQENQQLSGWSE
ncbi:hypothetical protein PM023_16150 [Halorubrum ezzemoulense]|uniref:hypothetical protein n=1 Tax=Halorubrum ezzemoulense TaxID=337243 RepID=UPI00232BA0CE|nr:hypothetical protein [Halorubrum ezzemoulense]MDB2226179.1 hypothetical protein [Halorubrum ezzemoulense]